MGRANTTGDSTDHSDSTSHTVARITSSGSP
jgi:hypothetical protein